MKRINHKTLSRIIGASVLSLIFGYFIQPTFAGEGDSPLEAYFLPHNTELTGTIGSEFTSDYYIVIVPATGRLVVSLDDINLHDDHEQLSMSLFRMTQNSIGTAYEQYQNYVVESENNNIILDVIDIPDLARGIYFVKVWPNKWGDWDGADYKIKAEFTLFPPVVSDDIGDQKKICHSYSKSIPNYVYTFRK